MITFVLTYILVDCTFFCPPGIHRYFRRICILGSSPNNITLLIGMCCINYSACFIQEYWYIGRLRLFSAKLCCGEWPCKIVLFSVWNNKASKKNSSLQMIDWLRRNCNLTYFFNHFMVNFSIPIVLVTFLVRKSSKNITK